MCPKGIFFLFLFIIIDIVLKSIKDKKKIQEKRAKETKALRGKVPKVPKKTLKKQEPQIVKSEKPLGMKSFEEPFSNINDIYNEIQDEIGTEIGNIKDKKTLQFRKEEILKGIIYSEILSRPKSLRK